MSDHIAVTGNITSVPERVDIGGGVTVAKFGLACTERRPQDGGWSDGHTNFYNVSVFRRLGEHALASLTVGQRVVVIGTLKVRKWDNGTSRGTAVDLDASSIGPDLKFGTATFRPDRRDARDDGGDSDRREARAGDPGANAGASERPLVDASGWAVPAAVADTTPPPAAVADTPVLVGASAPLEPDETTPF